MLLTLSLLLGAQVPATPEVQRAEAAARTLAETLKTRLLQAMAEGGPAAAATVCAEEAQALTARVAADTGVLVGRSSLRLRNPANKGPEAVQAWLEATGERPAAGLVPVTLASGPGAALVVVPIELAGPCVACHGPREALSAEVQALLAARYPQDAAVGYAPGDLRGVVWAQVKP